MKSAYLFVNSAIIGAAVTFLVIAYGDNFYAFAIIVFLGLLSFIMFLGWPHFFASYTETDGTVIFDTTDPDKDTISLVYNHDPLSLAEKDYVIFDVVKDI